MSIMRRSAFVLLGATVMAVAGALPAMAIPGNDAFATAEALTLPADVSTDTTGATTELGEPAPSCGPVGATVWYEATPVSDASLDLSTFGSKFDTLIAAYTGTDFTDLVEVGCNDDAIDTGSMQAKLSVDAGAGQTLFIQAGGYAGASGLLKLSTVGGPLDNDLFAYAHVITALPFTTTQDTTSATTESGEPQPSCTFLGVGATRWFSYTPAVDNILRVDTTGSDFDTVLAVYTGSSLASLVLEECNDDRNLSTLESLVKLTAEAGTTYHIQASGLGDGAGSLVLNVAELVPPPNDDFEDAAAITNPGRASVSTSNATDEGSEPDPCEVGVGSTVWYSYTAQQPGAVLVDTHLSDFDTVIGVFMGTDLGSLEVVGCSDDASGPEYTSDLSFVATPGQTYYIQVGGYEADVGNVDLRLRTGVSALDQASAGAGDTVDICLLGLCVGLP